MSWRNRGGGAPEARDWLMIAVFAVMIAAPMAGQLGGLSTREHIREVEYRIPARPPSWPVDAARWKALPATTESFCNDHFGFRTWLGTVNGSVLAALGSSGSDRVLVGKNGWLYFRSREMIDEYRGVVEISEAEVAAWVRVMDLRRECLEGMGIPFVVFLVPSKITIYPEYLPDWVAAVGPSRSDLLSARMAETTSVDFVDLRPALLEAKRSAGKQLYYQTDSHWTPHGAFIGYREIMARVKHYLPGCPSVIDRHFHYRPMPRSRTDLQRMFNVAWGDRQNRILAVYRRPSHVRSVWELDGSQWRRCGLKETGRVVVTTRVVTDLEDAPSALVYRDSFTDAMVPLFNETFSSVVYAHHRRNRLDIDFVREVAPDIVILNLVDRVLPDEPRTVWGPHCRPPTP